MTVKRTRQASPDRMARKRAWLSPVVTCQSPDRRRSLAASRPIVTTAPQANSPLRARASTASISVKPGRAFLNQYSLQLKALIA